MNILRHGNPETKLFQCWSCGCVFEEETDKCKSDQFKDILGKDSGSIYYCRCPECNSIAELDCTFDARISG